MKIKVLKNTKEKIEFLLEESSPSFANALRRIMISEVPTMSVEWVDFHENSSALYDEIIAHRLAMIPIVFDPKKISYTEECKCGGEGCPLCQAVFAIEKTGPCVVHSSDMKLSNKDIKPTDPNFPIVELLKGNRIKFEAVAKLGIGKKHSKWQAANASYQYFPEVIVKSDNFKKYLDGIPKGILDIQGKKVTVSDYSKIDIVKKAAEFSEDTLEVKEDPTRFVFMVESVSGLPPEYIIEKAAQVLVEKAEEFKKQATKI